MYNNATETTIFSFFGPPGAGKGTLAERCKRYLGFEILSTGDLCRRQIAQQSSLADHIKEQLSKGKLISDEIIVDLVVKHLSQRKKNVPFILDGFPRTVKQAHLFLNIINEGLLPVKFKVIFFDLEHQEILYRLSNRIVCSNQDCQAVFSLLNLKNDYKKICEYCNSSLIKRADDELEVVKERLAHYPLYEKELMLYYKSINQPIEILDMNAKTASKVFENFEQIISQYNMPVIQYDTK